MTATTTKKAVARTVYRNQLRRKTPLRRKDAIAQIAEKAGLSTNGAATYFENFRTGKWAA